MIWLNFTSLTDSIHTLQGTCRSAYVLYAGPIGPVQRCSAQVPEVPRSLSKHHMPNLSFCFFHFFSASAFLLGLDLALFRNDFRCAWLAMALTI